MGKNTSTTQILITRLQTFKGLCADIVTYCESNVGLYTALDRRERITQEVADVENASASLESKSNALLRRRDVVRSLLRAPNLTAEMRRSLKTQLSTIKASMDRLADGSGAHVLSTSKVLCRRTIGDAEVESKFNMLDRTTMRSIEDFQVADETLKDERRILRRLYATKAPPAAQHARIMRCVLADELLVLFKQLYIKMRDYRFNRRALISHDDLEHKLAIYMRIEEQEKSEAAKEVKDAKDLATKRHVTTTTRTNVATAPVAAAAPAPTIVYPICVHPSRVRDITKSSVRASDIRDARSLLQRKVEGLDRRANILSDDHVADAYKRLSHLDEDASRRAKDHIQLYQQIIVALQSERCVHEIEREDLECELAQIFADT
jgi:hypothetical protein